MKERILEFLCCPACRSEKPLSLSVFQKEEQEIIDGALRCVGCGFVYFVVDGIPRMLPRDLYNNPSFVRKYRQKLGVIDAGSASSGDDPYGDLKRATSIVYGFEWQSWNRHGWDIHQGAPTEVERQTFHHKTLLSAEELRGKVVLDAGSGNGRYAFTAAQHCKELIGLDLSAAVESAYDNLRGLPNAHIVQGDILRPPIRSNSLDAVYSIGVLMITGDTELAARTLGDLLKPGGTITVHVYAAGFPTWQVMDRVVREVTLRLSVPMNVKIAKGMSKVATAMKAVPGLTGYTSLLLRVWPEEVLNFDWYATPKQTYHTYDEMRGWFRNWGWEVVGDNQRRLTEEEQKSVRKRLGTLVWREAMATVRARKPGTPATSAAPRPASSAA